MSLLLSHALQYAERGWRVFPCRPRAKEPLTANGFKAATVAPLQIRSWWHNWPDANVAIATGTMSGILVIDIDGQRGLDALRLITTKHGPLTKTAVVRTGKGFHLYYNLAPGERYKSDTGKGPEQGLDIRCEGGYVLAPPSVHPSGATYQWDLTLVDGSDSPPIFREKLPA